MATLEESRDLLAKAIVKRWAAGRSATGRVAYNPSVLHAEYGGPKPQVAGRIGRRYLRSLNDVLRPHKLEVTAYDGSCYVQETGK